jgi:hypothetical protein
MRIEMYYAFIIIKPNYYILKNLDFYQDVFELFFSTHLKLLLLFFFFNLNIDNV